MAKTEIPPELKETLSLYEPKVLKNVVIGKPSDFPTPLLYHITTPGVPNPFWPRMPKSAAPSEDSTVPRVITASTLIGCMNGAAFVVDNATIRQGGDFDCSNYYHILGFEFDYCLLPNNELVYDAEDTQEAWLVAYSRETRAYKHRPIGEFFMHSIVNQMMPNAKVNQQDAIFYLKVTDKVGLAISKGKVLSKGFYKLEIDMTRYVAKRVRRMRYDDDQVVRITEVSQELYESYRKISVKKGY